MQNLPSVLQSLKASGQHFPYISQIVPSDKELLRTFVHTVRPDSSYYEDSWGYILQATRYGQCKWYDPETNSLIFFGRKTTSPELVVSVFFATPEYLSTVLQNMLAVLPTKQAILKNANPSEMSDFSPFGFRPYHTDECWSAKYHLGDQTYPQLLVDLQKIIKPRGDAFQNLRTTLNKKPGFLLRTYRDTDRDAVMKIFLAVDAHHNISQSSAVGYYETHNMYPDSDTEKFVITDGLGTVIGFTATSEISDKTTAFVAAMFLPNIKWVSTWGVYQTLIMQYHNGFQFANLGGCGSKTVYEYKREKFRPIVEIEKTHLVYELKS